MSWAIDARSASRETTADLATALAPLLRAGDVVCLDGELGAGKTTFVAALSRALGVQQDVVSPTFTLENRYPLEGGEIPVIVHCDLYRPGEDAHRDLLPSMLEARQAGALLAVEWADPVKSWLTPYLQLTLRWEGDSRSGDVRRIRVQDVPEGWPRRDELLHAWQQIADVEVST